jgi:DNA-binding PadR family transcriptional regulator
MSESPTAPPSLWALTILCLLREAPMHPYEMQRLIRQRKKDDFLELKRGSLYHNIDRLQRSGFIEQGETSREGHRPERTVYRLTSAGERALVSWLHEMLANPAMGPVQFLAALGFLGHLPAEDVVKRLSGRMALLEAKVHSLDAALAELTPRIGRLLLIEAEYERAMHEAEMTWIRSLIQDIQRGALDWKPEAFFKRP